MGADDALGAGDLGEFGPGVGEPADNCRVHRVVVAGDPYVVVADTVDLLGSAYDRWNRRQRFRRRDVGFSAYAEESFITAGREVAPYGTTVQMGANSCTITEKGVSCKNIAGNGFQISRAGYQFF